MVACFPNYRESKSRVVKFGDFLSEWNLFLLNLKCDLFGCWLELKCGKEMVGVKGLGCLFV
jgi:hypothetical protein